MQRSAARRPPRTACRTVAPSRIAAISPTAECRAGPIELRRDRERPRRALSSSAGGGVLNELALEARGLTKLYGGGHTLVGRPRPANHAVNDVALSLSRGETLGIVGESGCGKSTLARMLAGLTPPSAGTVSINGQVFVGDRTAPPRVGQARNSIRVPGSRQLAQSAQDDPQHPRGAAHSPGAARSRATRRARFLS